MTRCFYQIIDSIQVIEPHIFQDHRGSYIESFNKEDFFKNDICDFIQDDFSTSHKGVFRGLHGDTKTWKLVSCIHGELDLIILNCEINSKNFGKNYLFKLSDKTCKQVLIPPLFANGHYVRSEKAIFHYKQSTNYLETPQFSINYKSKILQKTLSDIKKVPILSERDSTSSMINDLESLKIFYEKRIKG